MRELNRFGEKASDLDFGIHARLEAAKEFHDTIGFHDNGGVRLLGVDGMDVVRCRLAILRKPGRRLELDATLIGFNRCRGAQVLQQKRNEVRIRRGIEQGALPRPAADGGERVRVVTPTVQPGPTDGQRQQVVRRTVAAFGLDNRQPKSRVGGHERDSR